MKPFGTMAVCFIQCVPKGRTRITIDVNSDINGDI
jgi:hypothetical protein